MHVLLLSFLLRIAVSSLSGANKPVTADELPSGTYHNSGKCAFGNYGNLVMEVTTLGSGQAVRLGRSDNFDIDGMMSAVPVVWRLTPDPGTSLVGMNAVRCYKFSDDEVYTVVTFSAQGPLGYSREDFTFCTTHTEQILAIMSKSEQFVTKVQSVCIMNKDAKSSSGLTSSAAAVDDSTTGPSGRHQTHREVFRPAQPAIPSTSKIVNKGVPLPSAQSTPHTVKASAIKRSSTTLTSELGEPSDKVALVPQTVRVTPQPTVSGGLTQTIIKEGMYSCDEYKDVKECSVAVAKMDGSMKCSITFKLTSGIPLHFPIMELIPSKKVMGCLGLLLPSDISIRDKFISDLKILGNAINALGTIQEKTFNICNKTRLLLIFTSRYVEPSNKEHDGLHVIRLKDF